jgi:8-oxo-dGTP pyrophosphatase MutT (NUDIX family)
MSQVATVRVIVIFNNTILLLQKSIDSKNPNSFEFPGGKVDSNALYNLDQVLKKTAARELYEETKIVYQEEELKKLEYNYEYSFTFNNETFERKVYFFCARVNAAVTPILNETKKQNGESEDKHSDFRWVTTDLYQNFIRTGSVSKNSILPIEILQNCFKD